MKRDERTNHAHCNCEHFAGIETRHTAKTQRSLTHMGRTLVRAEDGVIFSSHTHMVHLCAWGKQYKAAWYHSIGWRIRWDGRSCHWARAVCPCQPCNEHLLLHQWAQEELCTFCGYSGRSTGVCRQIRVSRYSSIKSSKSPSIQLMNRTFGLQIYLWNRWNVQSWIRRLESSYWIVLRDAPLTRMPLAISDENRCKPSCGNGTQVESTTVRSATPPSIDMLPSLRNAKLAR